MSEEEFAVNMILALNKVIEEYDRLRGKAAKLRDEYIEKSLELCNKEMQDEQFNRYLRGPFWML